MEFPNLKINVPFFVILIVYLRKGQDDSGHEVPEIPGESYVRSWPARWLVSAGKFPFSWWYLTLFRRQVAQ
jgi:hypothetical protein